MTAIRGQGSPTASDYLSDAERKLLKAAATGTLVDLRTGDINLDNPANAADWDDDRDVRADFLADLLTGDQPTGSGHLRSVKLAGARIRGELDLEARKLLCPLLFQACYFAEPVNFSEAEAVSIRLPGCHVPSLSGDQLRTVGSVELDKGFTACGEVRLPRACIGGQLNLGGASLANDNGLALNATGITVSQGVFCSGGFTAQGEISLSAGHIGGPLDLSRADLANDNGPALNAIMITVGQGMFCNGGFTAQGEISLGAGHISGQLNLSGASLANHNGPALYADQLTIEQSMFCKAGFTARGEVRLPGAHIGGQFDLSGAKLTNDNGPALNADQLAVGQDMFCDGGFTAQGEVRLPAARIGGQLSFSGAKLTNDNGPALNADQLTVGQGMRCSGGFTAQGEIRLPAARIGGQLSFSGAKLTSEKRPALYADQLTVEQNMYCRRGFSAKGAVRLQGARIGDQLFFSGAALANSSGPALDAYALIVGQGMFCDDGFTAQGSIILWNAKVSELSDDANGWPEIVDLRGFVYGGLGNSDVNVRQRLRWLQRNPGRFTPQIYDQLADVYQQAGEDQAAQKVLVAKQWRRRKPYNPLSWLWWFTVGYGYRTWQAFIWAAALTLLGALVFSDAYPAHMVALNGHPPRFQPVIYALDVMLPTGSLGQKSAWQPTGGYLDWYWVLAIAGWVLSAAVVAGLTGILKRD